MIVRRNTGCGYASSQDDSSGRILIAYGQRDTVTPTSSSESVESRSTVGQSWEDRCIHKFTSRF